MMRAFIGIDFSPGLKRQLGELSQLLRRHTASGRWKHADNFHITLKFLGDIDDGQVEQIDCRLGRVVTGRKKFHLTPEGLGSFPGRDCVRVLWLGLGGELDCLYDLHKQVEDCLVDLGMEKENRSYKPHITLAQDLQPKAGVEQLRALAEQYRPDAVEVDRIHLIKSEQLGGKRIYTPIKEYRFA